jgi:hypothetical protein
MKYYTAHEPITKEEHIADAITACVRIVEEAHGGIPGVIITELYTVGNTLFAHTADGDLFSIAVQKLTPTHEVTDD